MSEIGEKTDAEEKEARPWEACLTIGTSWGYRRDDGEAKSSTELIRTLVDVVSRGGNLLLNVGPKPDGTIPEHLVARLNDIGAWLEKNGESIYGTRKASGITASSGKLTAKEDALYLHLESRDADTVTLTGLKRPIKSARLLETGEALTVDDSAKAITLPGELPDPAVSVIVIDLD
jgi:alpha-L-fucosidase